MSKPHTGKIKINYDGEKLFLFRKGEEMIGAS